MTTRQDKARQNFNSFISKVKQKQEENKLLNEKPYIGGWGYRGELPTQQEQEVLLENRLYDAVEDRILIPRNMDDLLEIVGY